MTASQLVSIALPVVLGAIVWAIQTLAQRGWTEYERKQELYRSFVRQIDSLFTQATIDDRQEYLRTVREIWLVGSDDVINAVNKLSSLIKESRSEEYDVAYSDIILALRKDLRTRRWLSPTTTKVKASDFPVEGAGR